MAMNLLRPINIVAGERPLSIFETVSWRREGSSTSSKVGHYCYQAKVHSGFTLAPSLYFANLPLGIT